MSDLFARIVRLLVDVDGPQLVVAADSVNTKYLCVLVSQEEAHDRFYCVAASMDRLTAVLNGTLDLRVAFELPERQPGYVATLGHGLDADSTMKLEEAPIPRESWLPLPGLNLSALLPPATSTETTVVNASLERNRAVIDFRLDPPESRYEPAIGAELLADGITALQRFVRQAFKKAMSSLPDDVRSVLGTDDGPRLDVFAFAPGSFRVLLQSRSAADLLGRTPMSYAMRWVDEAVALIASPDSAIQYVKENRGHFVAAYRDFLRYCAESSAPVEYTWADPESGVAIRRSILPAEAATLYDRLLGTENLTTESLIVTGVFTRVDVNRGLWTLLKADGQQLKGELSEGVGDLLAGVTVETVSYSLSFDEHLEEVVGTGRQTPKRYLTSLRPLGA